MRNYKTLLLAGIISLGSTAVGAAHFEKGTKEVAFAGAFNDNDVRSWNLSGYYGYFLTQQLQVLGVGDLQGQSGASTTGRIGPGVDWHFMDAGMESIVPFAGVSYLVGVGSGTPDALELHIGIKQFVGDSVAVKYQAGYGFDPSDTNDSTFRASIGLSFFF